MINNRRRREGIFHQHYHQRLSGIDNDNQHDKRNIPTQHAQKEHDVEEILDDNKIKMAERHVDYVCNGYGRKSTKTEVERDIQQDIVCIFIYMHLTHTHIICIQRNTRNDIQKNHTYPQLSK